MVSNRLESYHKRLRKAACSGLEVHATWNPTACAFIPQTQPLGVRLPVRQPG